MDFPPLTELTMSLLSHVLGGMGSAIMPVNGFVLSRRVPVAVPNATNMKIVSQGSCFKS